VSCSFHALVRSLARPATSAGPRELRPPARGASIAARKKRLIHREKRDFKGFRVDSSDLIANKMHPLRADCASQHHSAQKNGSQWKNHDVRLHSGAVVATSSWR
jgi:hypothetical protein